MKKVMTSIAFVLLILILSSCNEGTSSPSSLGQNGSAENWSSYKAIGLGSNKSSRSLSSSKNVEFIGIDNTGSQEKIAIIDKDGNNLAQGKVVGSYNTGSRYNFLLLAEKNAIKEDWPYWDSSYVPSATEKGQDLYLIDKISGKFYLLDGQFPDHKLQTDRLGFAEYGDNFVSVDWSWSGNSQPIGFTRFKLKEDGSIELRRHSIPDVSSGLPIWIDRYANIYYQGSDGLNIVCDSDGQKYKVPGNYSYIERYIGYNGIKYVYQEDGYYEYNAGGVLVKSEYVPRAFMDYISINYSDVGEDGRTIVKRVKPFQRGNVHYYTINLTPNIKRVFSNKSKVVRVEFLDDEHIEYNTTEFEIQDSEVIPISAQGSYVKYKLHDPLTAITDNYIYSYMNNTLWIISMSDGSKIEVICSDYKFSLLTDRGSDAVSFSGKDKQGNEVCGYITSSGDIVKSSGKAQYEVSRINPVN